jgi:hypothetical protein
MEKLQPSSIVLDISKIGTIDRASDSIKEAERKEELEEYMSKQTKKRRRRKARGRGSTQNETRTSTRIMFEKKRDDKRQELEIEFTKKKEETKKVEGDLDFLAGIDDKFDAEDAYLNSTKRAKTEE